MNTKIIVTVVTLALSINANAGDLSEGTFKVLNATISPVAPTLHGAGYDSKMEKAKESNHAEFVKSAEAMDNASEKHAPVNARNDMAGVKKVKPASHGAITIPEFPVLRSRFED